MLFFALHGWCFLGFSVELIIPAIHFPNVSPLSSLPFLPFPPPSPHQLLLTADASDVSLVFLLYFRGCPNYRQKTKSLLNCSQCNNKLFILLVCPTVLLLFFPLPFLLN